MGGSPNSATGRAGPWPWFGQIVVLESMRCPTLHDLPPPPPGRTGWPWTEESSQLPDRMPDGSLWPRISIVTPSYNQGQFIEETIRSVLLQGFPNLEYIVMDGGSTDGSVEIIKKYEPWLAYWISKMDHGQSDAINKGLIFATGDIVAWVNSDDYYHAAIFAIVAQNYSAFTSRPFWFATAVDLFEEESGTLTLLLQNAYSKVGDFISAQNYIHSAGVFWDRSLVSLVGLMNVDLHYGFDKEYWMRFMVNGCACIIDNSIVSAVYRLHPASKTVSANFAFKYEWAKVGLAYEKYAGLDRFEVRDLQDQLIYNAIRLAQNSNCSTKKRVRYLMECLACNPLTLLRRDWLGTLLRVLRVR